MSEEEKKAIELLKQEPDYSLNYYNRENAIDIVLKLIEKQQKEIEELKVINQMQKYRIETIDEREFVSKDKIREKIEDLEGILDLLENEKNYPKYKKQDLIEEINDFKELLEE